MYIVGVLCIAVYCVCVVRCSADSTMMTKERNNMRARVQSLLMARLGVVSMVQENMKTRGNIGIQ